MRPFHHREPGLAGLGLFDEDLYIEVIADGAHLHPETLRLIFNTKRLDRIMLVSDSIRNLLDRKGPVYIRRILAGGGMMVSDFAPVLQRIGVSDAEITEAAFDNPKRYLGI
jgi:N-acetylglucosamine-6-phosphate deacetylase